MNLNNNLYSKHKLKFKDGKFKILMMSDIQETLDYNPKTFEDMNKLIENVKPDFIILGGDNCNGLVLKTADELSKYLKILSSLMEKRQIPWAHIFGNHDHDIQFDDTEKTILYEACPYCVSKHTEGVYGTTNFVLPILSSDESSIAFNIWGLDTNNLVKESDMAFQSNFEEFTKPSVAGPFDGLHFEQLMWYWNSSKELEEYNKGKINGIMFMHIPPWEFQYVMDNPDLTGAFGSMIEPMGLSAFNSGIFATVLQRGDIRCIASGHSHCDSFQGTFSGIKLCLDGSCGYSSYGDDNVRGGRVFEIDESNTSDIKTYMIHYKDL